MRREVRKNFFFEKKTQKAFGLQAALVRPAATMGIL
jgi:hypothetical protein